MERKILEYEKFIADEVKRDYGVAERKRLAESHALMLKNFQHERLVHLIVTLFFAFLAVEFVLIAAWTVMEFGLMVELLPLYFITLILTILTVFYVKHYYFLENHIQKLYKYTKQIGV